MEKSLSHVIWSSSREPPLNGNTHLRKTLLLQQPASSTPSWIKNPNADRYGKWVASRGAEDFLALGGEGTEGKISVGCHRPLGPLANHPGWATCLCKPVKSNPKPTAAKCISKSSVPKAGTHHGCMCFRARWGKLQCEHGIRGWLQRAHATSAFPPSSFNCKGSTNKVGPLRLP